MAKKEFVFQGFTARTHVKAICDLFDVKQIDAVIVSVAFMTESGLNIIFDKLQANGAHLQVLAGIRNDITTHQGFQKLLSVTGSSIYAVDTGSRTVTFHPKVFLVRGNPVSRMIIGSANLTLGGLNNNIEAGLSVEFDMTVPADKNFVDDMVAQFAALPGDYPGNILQITTTAQLDALLQTNRLVDEDLVRPPRAPSSGSASGPHDPVSLIKLKTKRITRPAKQVGAAAQVATGTAPAPAPTPSGPAAAPPAGPIAAPAQPPALPVAPPPATIYRPVWRSLPLKHRSLTLKKDPAKKTKPTGSTTLGKGAMPHIDQTTYFRDQIFGHLPWAQVTNQQGNPAERVEADFDLFIRGINVGRFEMTIRHSLTRAAVADLDSNLPTEISWNAARPYVADPTLLGCIMTLLVDLGDPNHFAIQID